MSTVNTHIKRSRYNFKSLPTDGEPKVWGKSMTIQDDSMSIKEMLQRVQSLPSVFDSTGEQEADFDDFDYEKIGRADVNSQMRINEEHRNKVQEAKIKADLAKKRKEEEAKKNPKKEGSE